jgi:hypothetical protein
MRNPLLNNQRVVTFDWIRFRTPGSKNLPDVIKNHSGPPAYSQAPHGFVIADEDCFYSSLTLLAV